MCTSRTKNTAGGGLALFLHERYQGRIIHPVSLQLQHIESLFLEVTGKVRYVVVVYRPPNESIQHFYISLQNILDYISHRYSTPCYFGGDFNINLLNRGNSVHDFINLLFSYSYFPTIIKPTRVTNLSAILLDNV